MPTLVAPPALSSNNGELVPFVSYNKLIEQRKLHSLQLIEKKHACYWLSQPCAQGCEVVVTRLFTWLSQDSTSMLLGCCNFGIKIVNRPVQPCPWLVKHHNKLEQGCVEQ